MRSSARPEFRPSTNRLLDAMERFARKKFAFRREIGLLFELAEENERLPEFHTLTFYAKFVSNASVVLKRVGSETEETSKLSGEFTKGIEQAASLARELIRYAPADDQKLFSDRFLALTSGHLDNFLALLAELTRAKNYFLDQERLPG